ncbi:MAG: hypothetical protein ACFFBW_06650 [Promethearchaeota archaeon]
MEREKNSEDQNFYEDIIKKTKTGITFPKELREILFDAEKDVFFKLTVPKEKNKIILDILSEDEVKLQKERIKAPTIVDSKITMSKVSKKATISEALSPNWANYFIYDFKNQDKVKPILESAFYKFTETPINLEDAMGRVKYALVSFLSNISTENSKLYYSVIRFLIDIIEKFDQANLLDWIFEKIIPNIKSKFLYELALLDLLEASLIAKRWEKAELYIFYVLKNIDEYPKSEMYNIMNSFKQLVKTLKDVERSAKIDLLLKEKLMEFWETLVSDDIDYKIQVIEFLEDLQYIELAYKLAKDTQKSLPSESVRVDEIRKLVRRLYVAPISENKPESSVDFDELEDEEQDEEKVKEDEEGDNNNENDE